MNKYTYYLTANTGNGYTSFFDEIINDFKRIIVLKNAAPNYKAKLFNNVLHVADRKGLSYDKVIRCGTIDEIDCLLFHELSTVITVDSIVLSKFPLHTDIIDFVDLCDCDFSVKKELTFLNNKISRLNERMFSHLKEAKHIHDEWEKIYISNLDFDIINDAFDDVMADILNEAVNSGVEGENVNRFFGTLLPRGSINYIDELTENLNKRIFIKGRPGTGKSTLLKKLGKTARERGYNTETYFCSLDMNSLDMVIIRELGICLFDSTAPHEKFPERDGDIVFDVYESGKKIDIDEYYSEELMVIKSRYDDEIKKAKECLYTASALRSEINRVMNVEDTLIDNIINKIILMSSI